MDPTAESIETLLWWSVTLLLCACVLLAEAGALTFCTSLWRRPWYERLLALAPLGVFIWAALAARQAHDTYLAAQDYATFIRAHYPEEFVWRGGELTAAAERIGHSGSLVVAATVAALVLGALVLLTRWREARGRQSEPPESDSANGPELEITVQALGDAEDSPR